MRGRIIVQWDKEAVEGARLVKIDLLGLGMLEVIDRCFDLIAQQTRGGPLQRAGERPALHRFRCDDPAVYALLCAADAVGVFQVESRAQISACLPHLQPRCYEGLIVAVALIHPGPIQGNATQPYLPRRHGEELIRYPGGETGRHLLEPILGETLGVCLYQDQVIGGGPGDRAPAAAGGQRCAVPGPLRRDGAAQRGRAAVRLPARPNRGALAVPTLNPWNKTGAA
jgi:error-prone DNA polymerase